MTTTKRKRDEDVPSEEDSKRQKRVSRSNSEPSLESETDQSEKKVALRRLFGRVCSVDLAESNRDSGSDTEEVEVCSDEENDDPLLDSIPVDMDPEQLGFLVCAQETLRFLHRRGMSVNNPMFAKLRSRFLRGINEMGLA